MRVFKFGGASVKDAEGVRNLGAVLKTTGYDKTLVVVSAMGKTTNRMELVIKNYFENKTELQSAIHEVVKCHDEILKGLFDNKRHQVFTDVKVLFDELNTFFKSNKSPDYNFVYDQTIGFGELISTTIISHYLNEIGLKNNWIDVREFIKTDSYYRRSNVNWEQTQTNIASNFDTSILNITQGFLASDANNFTTTLGREGSDYTAAIFAYCLNANNVTIWKDVPGVLNADPRYFENTQLLHQISYREAIELAFYGASVIHPKTLQPLERKDFFNTRDKLNIILVSGVNGVGKTTSIGKIGKKFRENNSKVLFSACDTFRAAAIDQLEQWANKINVEIVLSKLFIRFLYAGRILLPSNISNVGTG